MTDVFTITMDSEPSDSIVVTVDGTVGPAGNPGVLLLEEDQEVPPTTPADTLIFIKQGA